MLFNVIHVTHEAVYKVGGIGTVLEGLINSRPYRDHVGRTVLVCPLFYPGEPKRLGPGGVIEYSSLDSIHESQYADAFRRIEADFNVHIVYGHRPVEDAPTKRRVRCEVLLVDLRGIRRERVNELKKVLWNRHGLPSDRYEHIWEYEQYVQLAAPAAAALDALELGTDELPAFVLAHEFMGVPTALALAARHARRYRTLFYAHEVATVRRIVEAHPGHDVMFYNVLELARRTGVYLDEVLGPQDDYFKHAVVEAACHCDGTLAVGHHVVRELEFLGPRFEETEISLAYNGIPAHKITLKQRQAARERLRNYFGTLLGWRPDRIFTHVTRFVQSKALWRDLDVLEALEPGLARRGESAVLLVLSTEMPRRPSPDILHMEQEWDWPLAHREGMPDLTEGEARFYQKVQIFNARARNIRVVFVNQFGFDRETCGNRVPEDVQFMDVRHGSDVELGLSLYEPFGISPLEPLTFGGICVVSTTCGCTGFLQHAAADKGVPNVILADFIHADGRPKTVEDAAEIGADERRDAERRVAKRVAAEILERLPTSAAEEQQLIRTGYELARQMSWDLVAERYILPAFQRAGARQAFPRLAKAV